MCVLQAPQWRILQRFCETSGVNASYFICHLGWYIFYQNQLYRKLISWQSLSCSSYYNYIFSCLQKYHRSVLLLLAPPGAAASPPPPFLPSSPPPFPVVETQPVKVLTPAVEGGIERLGRDKRPDSRHHRKVVAGDRDTVTKTT